MLFSFSVLAIELAGLLFAYGFLIDVPVRRKMHLAALIVTIIVGIVWWYNGPDLLRNMDIVP